MRAKLPDPLLDSLITAALVALTLANVATRPGVGWVVYVLGVLTVAPLALRQVAPVVVMVLIAGAVTAYSTLDPRSCPTWASACCSRCSPWGPCAPRRSPPRRGSCPFSASSLRIWRPRVA